MVRQFLGGFEQLDHILCAGRLYLFDDGMHLQFHPKSSHSRTNVGLFPVPDYRGMAAFVGTLPGRGHRPFRVRLNVVTACVEPSSGPVGKKSVGFQRCQTRPCGLANICRSLAGLAAAFAAPVNAA